MNKEYDSVIIERLKGQKQTVPEANTENRP